MTDLTTTYMGLTLKNPIVPSASPLSKKIDGIRQMEDAGAAAITMYSLFEEQIDLQALAQHRFIEETTFMSAEATAYFPKAADFNRGPDGYLDLIREAKAAVDVPIIGSLNGVTPGGWTRYAKLIEEAGADALELNVYLIPTRTDLSSDGVENTYLEILREVKAQVKIPVAMKLSPFFSALPNMAHRLDRAGADGLVLFNRFYQPDFDLEELTVVPHLVLSNSNEMRLPLRWIAILYGHVKASLALTTGIHSTDGCGQGDHGRRRHRQCRIGAAGARRRGHHRSGERRRPVDGRARVRVDGPDEGRAEPAKCGRAGCV